MRGRRRILFLFKLGANEQRRISSKACESARAAAVGLKKNCRVARLFFFSFILMNLCGRYLIRVYSIIEYSYYFSPMSFKKMTPCR